MNAVHHQRQTPLQDYVWRDYTRDLRDRITAFKKGTSGSNPMENGRGDRFRYDEEGQLVEAWYNAADPVNSGAGNTRYDGFNYDALGNRRGSNHLANRGWMTFTRKDNGLNQYRAWMPFSITNYDDDIAGWGAPEAANGVLMQDGNITAGFNALNQPTMINAAAFNGNWMFFGFDPLGRCVKRWMGALHNGGVPPENSNPATYFYYDGWNLIQEGPGASSASRTYVHGGRVDEILQSRNVTTGQVAYHHYDARGHAILLTNSSGGIMEQYEYDAFGKPYFFNSTAQPLNSSTFENRFLFTGREYLSELKLYDYRNRMYHPELGRFLQPDPKHFEAGDYNLYRYCHNDPINKVDPDGLAPVEVAQDVDSMARALLYNHVVLTNQGPVGSRLEAGSSIFRTGGQLFPSETRRGQNVPGENKQQLYLPKTPDGSKREADTHSHVVPKVFKETGGITSPGDIKRGDYTGKPNYTAARDKNGELISERYRPSDAKTEKERVKEGGILERFKDGKWEKLGR
jgi:RHS repeat-associated protein